MGTLAFGETLVGALGGQLTGSGVRTPPKSRSGAPHPTGAPVLRSSVEAGTFEHLFFVVPEKGETDRLLRAARRILDAGRQLRRENARAGGNPDAWDNATIDHLRLAEPHRTGQVYRSCHDGARERGEGDSLLVDPGRGPARSG